MKKQKHYAKEDSKRIVITINDQGIPQYKFHGWWEPREIKRTFMGSKTIWSAHRILLSELRRKQEREERKRLKEEIENGRSEQPAGVGG